ncbi:hypothetical protein AYO41_00680 [Verrucomicrobia bacterium SCGC AG-212-E04]|nr:hypothetical protein AYO41_00680 [Verrucomicrobia bacterium SCGC AG-212-E04]
MNIRSYCATLLAMWPLLALAPLVDATSDYSYKSGEYVTVKHGKSPDGKYAIATHGPAENEKGEFRVYLMDAKVNKVIGPLLEITEVSYQDTAPLAYHASWSADSNFVTISYRSDRRTISLVKYKIENRRAIRVKGPSPASDKEAAALGWPDPDN